MKVRAKTCFFFSLRYGSYSCYTAEEKKRIKISERNRTKNSEGKRKKESKNGRRNYILRRTVISGEAIRETHTIVFRTGGTSGDY